MPWGRKKPGTFKGRKVMRKEAKALFRYCSGEESVFHKKFFWGILKKIYMTKHHH